MSENKVQKLSKVAKEFNVSIGTIVDFLKGKGVAIESSPMAKVPEDIYSVLLKEYHSEKAAKEEAEKVSNSTKAKKESISLDVDAKKPEVRKEEEEIIIKNVQPVETVVPKEKPVVLKEVVKEAEPEVIPPVKEAEPEPAEEIKAKDSDIKVKVISKIDLDALNTKTKPDKKSKAEKEEEKKTVAKAKVKVPKEEEAVEKPVAEETPVVEKPAPVVVEAPKVVTPEPPKEDFYETRVEKLEGPKIMGRIELPVKEERKKPVASSSVNNNDKKKRKRIKKSFGGTTIGDTVQPKTGAGTGVPLSQESKEKKYGDRPLGTGAYNKNRNTGNARGPKVELTPEQIPAGSQTLRPQWQWFRHPNVG